MSYDLTGRVAIVTGASGGIGQAVCRVFQESGAQVLPVDIAGEGMFVADVGTHEGNQAMVDEAVRRFGRLDTLILNAGVQFMAPLPEFPEAEWDRLMNVMAKGPFLAIQAAWPHLTAKPDGRVVVTASMSSYGGSPWKVAYTAAKHAVLGVIKVAAIEGAPYGLLVNGVAPGWVRTPLVDKQMADQMKLHGLSREQVLEQMAEGHAVKRFIEPEEIAALIAFLAGPGGSAMTGTIVPINLGSGA
jgi:3-hydroxybutyrate dehydrogenase